MKMFMQFLKYIYLASFNNAAFIVSKNGCDIRCSWLA